MVRKRQVKIVLDALMSIALLFLMAFQVTGNMYHEWIGAGMLILFLLHNILNIEWYKALFKGKYSLLRIVRTVINLAVLIAIILTGYSGIVMSRHVFTFLSIEGGMALARPMHLAGSYWSFVLMSVHLGMHWSMMTSKMKGNDAKLITKPIIWNVLQIVAGILAIYGVTLFIRNGIFSNMLLQSDFAILDYTSPGVVIILQNFAMMTTWVFIGHYMTKEIQKSAINI